MDKISEITRRDIVDIIKNGFSVELDEEEYDSSSGEYINECTVIMPYSGPVSYTHLDVYKRQS